MAALPLGKLFGVAVKTISKPLANQLKSYAKESERFHAFNVALGNRIHRVQIAIFRQSHGDGTPHKKVKDLSPEKAMDVAATFIGEAFVFGVAVLVTVAEYSRQKVKESVKAHKQEEEEARRKQELSDAVAERDRRIDSLMEALPILDSKIEFLRGEFDTFRGEIVKALQLLNLSTPSLGELQSGSQQFSGLDK
eukprot:Plantae.Rhodophyta-Purpureofilum_apyrenoidigerum.ctg5361.p1 GENE.Plantae.Rhodophyta-Purpureofilum_apyrenoidigerum.ctg5361~~Plantae.Rhodophyta-Purpureofilum_apyrenoidigerum.ctg5361.p1  ORF type:complete len:194 (-),score=42.84 Plantae.Rhodophyta-Purpureofilum_apyrenoidigerum.ctg5361:634-1215(-)